MIQTGQKDRLLFFKTTINFMHALMIWIKERPTHVISTGTLIAIPFAVLAKISGRKLIFIETFARINDKTKTGALLYRFSDLFIVQWKSLLALYPNAVYGGSIF